MSLSAGKLRHIISIEEPIETQDIDGSIIKSWAISNSGVYASIEPLSGKEFISAKQEQHSITARITIRYKSGITTKSRVNYNNKIYNIHAVLSDIDSGIEYLTLLVSNGVNDD